MIKVWKCRTIHLDSWPVCFKVGAKQHFAGGGLTPTPVPGASIIAVWQPSCWKLQIVYFHFLPPRGLLIKLTYFKYVLAYFYFNYFATLRIIYLKQDIIFSLTSCVSYYRVENVSSDVFECVGYESFAAETCAAGSVSEWTQIRRRCMVVDLCDKKAANVNWVKIPNQTYSRDYFPWPDPINSWRWRSKFEFAKYSVHIFQVVNFVFKNVVYNKNLTLWPWHWLYRLATFATTPPPLLNFLFRLSF